MRAVAVCVCGVSPLGHHVVPGLCRSEVRRFSLDAARGPPDTAVILRLGSATIRAAKQSAACDPCRGCPVAWPPGGRGPDRHGWVLAESPVGSRDRLGHTRGHRCGQHCSRARRAGSTARDPSSGVIVSRSMISVSPAPLALSSYAPVVTYRPREPADLPGPARRDSRPCPPAIRGALASSRRSVSTIRCPPTCRSLSSGSALIPMPLAARSGRAGRTLIRTDALVDLLTPAPPEHGQTALRSPAGQHPDMR